MQRGIHKMRRIQKMRTVTPAEECGKNLTLKFAEPPKVVSLKLVRLT